VKQDIMNRIYEVQDLAARQRKAMEGQINSATDEAVHNLATLVSHLAHATADALNELELPKGMRL
jgi:cytochrome c553